MKLGRALRATIRLIPAGLSIILAILLLLPGVVVGWISPRARANWNDFLFTSWSRFNLWLVGARINVSGDPPSPPFLLVANHLSYVDILVLASQLDAVFVSKAGVKHWPAIGWATRLVRTIFIHRQIKRDIPRVIGEIHDRLRYGQGVIVFPEGTSSPGIDLPPFRPPLLEVAARADLPVDYASLEYRERPGENPAYLSVCWWGGMNFPGHFLRLLAMPGFDVNLTFGGEPISDADRKKLAERLHAAVSDIFVPTAPPEADLEDV